MAASVRVSPFGTSLGIAFSRDVRSMPYQRMSASLLSDGRPGGAFNAVCRSCQ